MIVKCFFGWEKEKRPGERTVCWFTLVSSFDHPPTLAAADTPFHRRGMACAVAEGLVAHLVEAARVVGVDAAALAPHRIYDHPPASRLPPCGPVHPHPIATCCRNTPTSPDARNRGCTTVQSVCTARSPVQKEETNKKYHLLFWVIITLMIVRLHRMGASLRRANRAVARVRQGFLVVGLPGKCVVRYPVHVLTTRFPLPPSLLLFEFFFSLSIFLPFPPFGHLLRRRAFLFHRAASLHCTALHR